MSNPSNTPDPTASRAILARRIVKQKEVVANFAAQISNIEADAEANQTRREKRGMFSRFFSLLDPSGGMSVLATIGLRQEQEKEEEKLEALEEEYAALEAAARLQQARLERDIRELAPPPIQSPTEPPPQPFKPTISEQIAEQEEAIDSLERLESDRDQELTNICKRANVTRFEDLPPSAPRPLHAGR